MNNGVHFSSNNDEWGTPADLYARLNDEFNFTLDVCAWDWNAKAPAWLTIFDDALSLDWFWVMTEVLEAPPVAYMNPPYGRQIGNWIRKAVREAIKGATVICLVPARTDTEWWACFWNHKAHRPRRWCSQVRFVKGRVTFDGAKAPAPFPSAIVVLSMSR